MAAIQEARAGQAAMKAGFTQAPFLPCPVGAGAAGHGRRGGPGLPSNRAGGRREAGRRLHPAHHADHLLYRRYRDRRHGELKKSGRVGGMNVL
jgi:hypothetical protein